MSEQQQIVAWAVKRGNGFGIYSESPEAELAIKFFGGELLPLYTAEYAETLRQQRDELLGMLEVIVANAVIQPDASMQGTTDCYAVPLADIDAARAFIAKAMEQ